MRFPGLLQEQIGEIENQPARSPVADGDPLRDLPSRSKTGKPMREEGNAEASRCFPRMGIRQQQVAACSCLLQILDVADNDGRRRHPGELCGRNRRDRRFHPRAHAGKKFRERQQQVGFGCDGATLAVESEVAVEHGVHQAGALVLKPAAPGSPPASISAGTNASVAARPVT